MKKKLISVALLIVMCLTGFTSYGKDEQPELIKGYATAYNGPTDTTCTGDKARNGICGGCSEYLGKTIVLYQRLPGDEVGEILGIWECLDSGDSTDAFKEGRLIDIWCEDLEACQRFMDRVYEDGCQGKVFIQVLEADG